MKNWLVALLGVSLVAISYTAYELELKKPAMPPTVETVATAGQSAAPAPSQKTEGLIEKPASAAPPSQTEPAEAKTPEPQVEEDVRNEVAKALPPESGNFAGDNDAEAGVSPAATPSPAVEAEGPSLAEKAMDTVASLLSGATGADDKEASTPGKTIPAGQKSSPSQTAVREPPLPPSAVLAPVARAVDTVRKLLSGGDDTKPDAGKAPSGAAVEEQARPSDNKPQEAEAKGLVERAIEAVTELVTPKNAVDEKNTGQTTVAGGSATKAPAPAAPDDNTSVAARSPEPSAATAEVAKPADGPIVPSFDVVRVERDGSAIIAGRAEPGADIELRAGGKTLGTATASDRGEFVIIPDGPLPAGSSALALEATSGDGKITKSDQVVTVAVPDPDAPSSSQVAAAPAPAPKSPVAAVRAQKAPEKLPAEIEIAAAPVAVPPAATAPEPKQKVATAPAQVLAPDTAMPAAKPQDSRAATARADNSPTVSAAAPVAKTTPVEAETPAPKPPATAAETKIASIPSGGASAPLAASPVPETKAAPAPLATAPAAPVEAPAPMVEAPAAIAKAPAPIAKAPAPTVEAPAPMAKLADTKTGKPGKSDGVENTQSAIIVPSGQTSPPVPETKSEAAVPKPQIRTPAAGAAPSGPAAPEVKSKVAAAPAPAEKSASGAATVTTPKTAKPMAPKVAEAPAAQVAVPAAPKISQIPRPEPEATKQQIAAAPKAPSDQVAGIAPADTIKAVRPVSPEVIPSPAATAPAAMDTEAGKTTPVAAPEAPPAMAEPKTETKTATVAAATPDTAPAPPSSPATQAPEARIAQAQTPAPVQAQTPAQVKAPAKLTEPLVVVSEPGKPSQVLQGGNDKPTAPITFETVDYDDEGQIILAGRVAPGADVRAYLGAAHLGDARADPQGQWVLRTTRQIDPGTYQLRIDKIDIGGKVLARVTAPFERAAPEAVARVRANGEVIIQPGDNLWNISRALYGTGTQYTVIYDANRNQISKPELIFPGQVFMTPGAAGAKAADATSG